MSDASISLSNIYFGFGGDSEGYYSLTDTYINTSSITFVNCTVDKVGAGFFNFVFINIFITLFYFVASCLFYLLYGGTLQLSSFIFFFNSLNLNFYIRY
jgi:hypothetical protein